MQGTSNLARFGIFALTFLGAVHIITALTVEFRALFWRSELFHMWQALTEDSWA
jgi:hypothetical protein